MPHITTIAVFFVSALLLSIAPGPDNLFVLAQSVRYGALSGVIITLGLCTGLIVHTLLVAFGVAALITASNAAFSGLQFAGALYLLYLAYKTYSSGNSEDSTVSELSGPELYRRGIIMNLTNPKVLLFFLSLLPQFADESLGPLPQQLIIFGIVFIFSAAIVFTTISLAAGTAGKLLRSQKGRRVLTYSAGTIFLGLGFFMVYESVIRLI